MKRVMYVVLLLSLVIGMTACSSGSPSSRTILSIGKPAEIMSYILRIQITNERYMIYKTCFKIRSGKEMKHSALLIKHQMSSYQ